VQTGTIESAQQPRGPDNHSFWDDVSGHLGTLAITGTFRAMPHGIMRARYGTVDARAIGPSVGDAWCAR